MGENIFCTKPYEQSTCKNKKCRIKGGCFCYIGDKQETTASNSTTINNKKNGNNGKTN